MYLELSSSSLTISAEGSAAGSGAGWASPPSAGTASASAPFLSPGMGIPEPSHPVIWDFTFVNISNLLPDLVGL